MSQEDNNIYPIANLSTEALNIVKRYEDELKNTTKQDIVLVAYEGITSSKE